MPIRSALARRSSIQQSPFARPAMRRGCLMVVALAWFIGCGGPTNSAPSPSGGGGGAESAGGGAAAVSSGGAVGAANGGVAASATAGTAMIVNGGTSGADAGSTASSGAGIGGAFGVGGAPGAPIDAPAGSPVAVHGWLKVNGNRVVGSDGQPAQLKGMSLYWSQKPAGSAFFNRAVVDWLADDWHAQIVRATIAVTGMNDGDYLSSPDEQMKLLDNVAQAAIEKGIYVLVDWHDHHANQHLDGAKKFFTAVSAKYGTHPNFIYEIWNEPRGNEGLTWTADLEPYADAIAAVIRKNDAANLIVVGTPFWDQQPDAVLGHPVADANVAYTLHFYAGSPYHHLDGPIGTAAKAALAGGLPLFVTEWGTTDPGAQTNLDEAETKKWMTFLDANGISSCNWSISGQNEGSCALAPGASNMGHWADNDLSASGRLVRGLIRGM